MRASCDTIACESRLKSEYFGCIGFWLWEQIEPIEYEFNRWIMPMSMQSDSVSSSIDFEVHFRIMRQTQAQTHTYRNEKKSRAISRKLYDNRFVIVFIRSRRCFIFSLFICWYVSRWMLLYSHSWMRKNRQMNAHTQREKERWRNKKKSKMDILCIRLMRLWVCRSGYEN